MTWTKIAITEAIHDWVRIRGYVPTTKEWDSCRSKEFPSSPTVKNKFGSWNQALMAAGYNPRSRGRRGHLDFDPENPTHHANIG